MLSEITIGRYIKRDSLIHGLDSRGKILITLLLIIGLFMVNNWKGYLLLALLLVVIIYLSQLQPGYLWQGVRPLLFIIAFTFLAHLLLTPGGRILWQAGPLVIYEGGLRQGLFLSGRILFLILFTTLLTLTTSPLQLTDGVEYLLGPLKRIRVPAHELAMMMTIALRFIPTLLEEAEKIMKAQKARGADFESGNLLKRARAFIPLLVPLFVSAFRRAEELSLAMEARAYQGGEGRTRMKELKFKGQDYLAFLLSLVFVVLAIII